MKNRNQLQRAAMGALVAAALMAGVQMAEASSWRSLPVDPSVDTRAGRRVVQSDAGQRRLMDRMKGFISSIRMFPADLDLSDLILRLPVRLPRNN